jgi:hypothetical protein
MKWSIGCALAVTAQVLPGVAMASPVHTPMGLVDSSCAFTVPNGAMVNATTGEVTLNGTLVSQEHCAASWSSGPTGGGTTSSVGTTQGVVPLGGGACGGIGATCTSDAQCCSGGCDPLAGECAGNLGGVWAAWSSAYATQIQGYTGYNNMQTTWTVPGAPNVGDGTNYTLLWTGLESGVGGPGGWYQILQPELVWHHNGWYITSQAGQNGGSYPATTPIPVAVGDTIRGTLLQISHNPGSGQGDVWNVITEDLTQGLKTTLTFATGSGGLNDPTFNWALMGVFEPQDVVTCYALPTSLLPNNRTAVQFFNTLLREGGPSWGSVNNATQYVSWSASWEASATPNCSYDTTLGTTIHGVVDSTTVSWTY